MTNIRGLDFQTMLRRVKHLAAQGKLEEANTLNRNLLKGHSQNKDVIIQRAILLTRMNQPGEIVTLLENVPIENLGTNNIHLLASAQFQIDNYHAAAEAYAQARPYESVRKMHARSLLMAGRSEEASSILREGYRLDRNILGAIRHWAGECAKKGQYEIAQNMQLIIEMLSANDDTAPARDPKSRRTIVAQIIRNPAGRPSRDDARNYAEWLLANNQMLATYAARRQVRTAITGGPENVQWIVEIVDDLREQRRYGAAVNMLSKGQLIFPDNVELASLHGEILLTIGKVRQAVPILWHAHWLKPSDAGIVEMLGIALERRGDIDGAISFLQEGRKNHPDDLHIATTLGQTLSKAGRSEEAIGLMRHVVVQFPGNARAMSTLGNVFLDARDYEAFDELMKDVPQRIGQSSRILRVQAYSKFMRYEKEAARRILEPVVLKQKGITAITVLYIACAENDDANLGRLKKQLGNAFERAVMRARELSPDSNLRDSVSRRYAVPTSPVMRERTSGPSIEGL